MTRPRVLFFGTPEFAVPALAALSDVAEVVCVVTQPDRPVGRGLNMAPPPVKVHAQELKLPVVQPKKIRTDEFARSLLELEADVALVIAYGRILPKAVLDAPRLGCVNVHASLLPRYRGAAPIQHSILHGDSETGVCLMKMDEGLDTGPLLACRRTPIHPDETSGQLFERLSHLSAELVREALPNYLAGKLVEEPQSDEGATLAPMLHKEDGWLDWTHSAREVYNRFRAVTPWPGAQTMFDSKRIKIHSMKLLNHDPRSEAAGTIVRADASGIDVACGSGIVSLLELQLEGRKRLVVRDFLAGHSLPAGERFLGKPA